MLPCALFSREFFQLDGAKDVIKLVIDLTTSEGTVIKMIKFLTRFDSSLTENVPFQLAARSNGWRIHDFWPSTVISSADAKIVKAAKIKFMNSATDEPTRILEELWSSESIGDVELNTLTRCFAGKSHENDDFVAFFVKVSGYLFAVFAMRVFTSSSRRCLSMGRVGTLFAGTMSSMLFAISC